MTQGLEHMEGPGNGSESGTYGRCREWLKVWNILKVQRVAQGLEHMTVQGVAQGLEHMEGPGSDSGSGTQGRSREWLKV